MRDKLCLPALDKQGRNAKMKMSSSREKYLEHVFHAGMSDLKKMQQNKSLSHFSGQNKTDPNM